MDFDIKQTLDSVKDGTKEIAEVAYNKTNEFHENYVSEVMPDCGKYGDEAKFVAEMLPGVAEYNAIRDGDWQAFAIAAGVDLAGLAIGAFTAGAGYAAVKGGMKIAAKEVAEAGAKKLAKEAAEAGAKKLVKETAEAGVEKAAKEVVEAGVEKAAKETTEVIAEKAVKETLEVGTEKVLKETTEEAVEKSARELTDGGIEHIAYYTDEFDRIKNTPKEGFEGLRGNSRCYPDVNTDAGKKAADKLAEYGQDSIKYENGVVDFSSVSETTVKIDMTDDISINFRNADKACSKKWNETLREGRSDWTASDIKNWRNENNFTWHERSDMKRCDLVSKDIHTSEVFSHYGGRAEVRAKNKVDLGGIFDE